jgi:hypothetical protein
LDSCELDKEQDLEKERTKKNKGKCMGTTVVGGRYRQMICIYQKRKLAGARSTKDSLDKYIMSTPV